MAIKKDFQETLAKEAIGKAKASESGADTKVFPDSQYVLKETSLDGVECYIVQKTISKEHLSYLKERAQQGLIESNNSLSKIFPAELMKSFAFDSSEVIAYLTEYTVRKSDFAVLSEREFSESGDIMTEVVYGEVQFGLPLADELFDVPKTFKIKKASTAQEYLALLKEARSNK